MLEGRETRCLLQLDGGFCDAVAREVDRVSKEW